MKGKRKIAAAFVLTLFAGMFPQQALAAGGDYQVTLGFFDGDQVDLSDVSSSSDDQIEEGHASVYDEAGDLVSEWDLDGETRTIDVEPDVLYRVETEFGDDSVYIDSTTYISRPDAEGTTKDYWFPVDVRARHLLPMVQDAEDGTILDGCTFTLYDSAGEEAGELTTGWTNEDISMLPALKAGTYTIEAAKMPEGYYFEGSQVIEMPYENVADNNRRVVTFSVGRLRGAVNLTAVDGEGNPIQGVTFQVKNKDTDEALSPVTTAEDGTVSMMDLPIGEYRAGKVVNWYSYEVVPVSVPAAYKDNPLEATELSFEEGATQDGSFLMFDQTFTYHADVDGSTGGEGGTDGPASGQGDQNGQSGQDGSGEGTVADGSGNGQDAARTGDTTNILLVVAVMEAALLVIMKRKGEMA